MWQWLWGETGILPIGIGFATIAITFHIVRRFRLNESLTGRNNFVKGHLWSLQENEQGGRCAVCDILLLPERLWRCEYCGLPVDRRCIHLANRRHPCKTSPNISQTEHLWVSGGSPDSCCFCNDDSHPIYSCAWCQKTAHAHCRLEHCLENKCDLGPYRQYIVPPGNKLPEKNNDDLASNKPCTPLLILANSKSGSNEAKIILRFFRRLLNPIQVADLSVQPADQVLKNWCLLFPDANSIILAAGGDGTVAWILSSINELNFKKQPKVGIIPLGTGNDLSRSLGWGPAWSASDSITDILNDLNKATPVPLDRWRVKIRQGRTLRRRPLETTLFMYNYLSVGVDALVALEFHRARQGAWWYLWPSRFLNKFLYLIFGTREAVESSCKGLERRLVLWLDGKPIALPQIQSVVILNISSWGSGVSLWPDPNASHNDTRLEIVGLTSSVHIAQLQVGIGSPIILGQASSIKLRLLKPTPIQIDGEPWVQTSADLEIIYENQALVLQRHEPIQH